MTEHTVDGLDAPVDIIVDQTGIPHIFAASDRDLYIAQGFTAAMFRLWQMDIWRKRGLGLLSSVFGAHFVEQDRARRLFLYRGSMEAEWAAYGPDVRDIVEAFVEGVNAFVALVERRPELLPPEYALTGDRPLRWLAEDIVRIRNVGLRKNVVDEFARARLMSVGALDADRYRRRLAPHASIVWPKDLDPALLPADALRAFEFVLREFDLPDVPSTEAFPGATLPSFESNVWAIGATRSQTGRPILANDPHRLHTLPSLRWLVHLCSPGVEAIGATEPVHPGVANGHNRDMAFGFTNSSCDQEDLFVYRLNPDNPDQYEWDGAWHDLQVVEETVVVKDGVTPRPIRLSFTQHGPVIFEDTAALVCIGVRSAYLEPGGAPYFSGVDYHRAGTLADFRERLTRAVAPTMNYCGADLSGNIGTFVRGLVPRRKGWLGLTPVPANGCYDWSGFHESDTLPTDINPACGWVGNCNQVPRPDDYPFDEQKIGFEFLNDIRFERLTSLIEDRGAVSIEDCKQFQCDRVLAPARPLARRAAAIAPSLPGWLRDGLEHWDGTMHESSAEAAFFAVWTEQHLRPSLIAHHVAPEGRGIVGEGDFWSLANAAPLPDDIVRDTAEAAFAAMTERLGSDRRAWRLGAVQSMTLRHPLGNRRGPAGRFDIGPVALGSHSDCLDKAQSFDGSLDVRHGPSFRIVLDVGDWNNCWAVNMPGQSGDPRSTHYADLFEFWRSGTYFRLLWDREDIEAAARDRITLKPSNR